ncbi:MAG TPA: protein kinase [Blastocatellia bacterium]|nr:protein kinase [Blastocatellia bacterium]
MTPEQYERVGEIYDALMELAPEARPSFLAEACGGEEELRREVESLLEAREQADGFIYSKVAGVVAEMAAERLNPSLIGRSLSHYQALTLLGAGGMGDVYLAQDTRLGRKVAIKLLPRAFTRDEERLRRFKQEALAASALNHPNILTVYDIGEHEGSPFIVTELLEGEELRKQMKEGPLPIRKAIEYARQIAAGLVAAHDRGIVHRDLKPENLFVTKDGLLKILDFGLAKLRPHRGVWSGSETATQQRITTPGTVMGTAAYMSPEQMRGQETDHRSDIFSFGLVFYEMLAGRHAFQGESLAVTMAAILNDEPPEFSGISGQVSPQIELIVARCLEKQPARRFQTASDLGFALEALTSSGTKLKEETASSATKTVTAPPWRIGREKWRLASTALAAILAAGFAWAYFTRPSLPEARSMKLSLSLPEKTKFRHIAVSPDGAWLAFTSETEKGLWTLALATGEAKPLAGYEGATYPFWSPDSRFIGFFESEKLKKIEVTGGLPITICDVHNGMGGSWSRAGVIIFGALDGGNLSRVSATGGTPATVLRNDLKRREMVLRFPSFLPDGHHFLYSVGSNDKEARGVYLGSLDGGLRQRLVGDYSNAIYVASPKDGSEYGYLLFGHDRSLMAQPFDAKTLRLSSEPFTVADQIATIPNSVYRTFSASDNGALVFDPEPKRQHKQAFWVDRAGKTINTMEQFDDLRITSLAPDGRRFVATTYDLLTNNFDLWLSDVTGAAAVRFTFDPGDDYFPVWSPDASRIAWAAYRDGAFHLYEKAVNGAGKEAQLFQSDYHTIPTDWSRDGRFIIFRQSDPVTKSDIWALPLFGEQKPFPLLQTTANEDAGTLSPDGQWLTYLSNESGRYEVYIQSFPGGGGKQRVSTGGGFWPYWRGDGKELYYHAADGNLMAAPVRGGMNLTIGAPLALFALRPGGQPDQPNYSVDRDGRRFLLNAVVETKTNSPLTVMVNWTTGLKK